MPSEGELHSITANRAKIFIFDFLKTYFYSMVQFYAEGGNSTHRVDLRRPQFKFILGMIVVADQI